MRLSSFIAITTLTGYAIANIHLKNLDSTAGISKNVTPPPQTPVLSCHAVKLLPNNQQCQFVKDNCQEANIGFIDTFQLYYCVFQKEKIRRYMVLPIIIIILILLFASLGIIAGDFLCPNLSAISEFLKIPQNISGLTLLAFGNGSPDIVSTYASFITNNPSMAIGELIGASFFINCFIVGIICIIHPFNLLPNFDGDTHDEVNKLVVDSSKLVYVRDIFFFSSSIGMVLICLKNGVLTNVKMMVLISTYVIYVILIVFWQWYLDRKYSKLEIMNRIRNLYDDNVPLNIGDENVELEDSYIFNPMMFRTTEFGTILNSLTQKRRMKLRLNSSSRYRDEETGSPDPNQSIELIQEQNGPAVELEVEYGLFKSLFNFVTLPMITVFRYTIPLMRLDSYETEFKPDFIELIQLLASLVISQFLFIHTFIPSLPLIWRFLTFFFSALFTYVSYDRLIQSEHQPTTLKLVISCLGFMTSISWISIIAEEIISILQLISILSSFSKAILGLTVFAIGNSIGDLISNIVIARLGYPLTSLAACFGSPLLNLLLGIGLNGIIVGHDLEIKISPGLLITGMAVLINLIFMLVWIPVNKWRFDRTTGIFMICIWLFGTLCSIVVELIY